MVFCELVWFWRWSYKEVSMEYFFMGFIDFRVEVYRDGK